jgi:hypothetical protein
MVSRFEELYVESAVEMLSDLFGDTVAYHREGDSVSLTAIQSNRLYRVPDVEGFTVEVQVEDFRLVAADLRLSGVVITPRSGDRIRRTISGVVHVYEVLPLANRPCFEHRVGSALIDVHTKFVGTE